MFEDASYVVHLIDGDYAHLRRTDKETDDLKLVAMALLPNGIDEGTKMTYSNFEYVIV